ncbi:MAG: sensor histidine kinase [Bryobacterales bacterium]|nr:sensor histidine kinase [Bryobacterales bacterium]
MIASIATALIAGGSVIPVEIQRVALENADTPYVALVATTWIVLMLALLTGSFAAIFFRLTSQLYPPLSAKKTKALVLFQLLLACATATELFYLLAAEVGYLFPGRRGWMAVAILTVSLLLVAGAALVDGSFEAASELAQHSPAVRVSLTLFQVLSWFFFAFAIGRIAASERQGREELEASLHEISAMHHLLEGSAKVTERLRIARELHDALGHHLTSLNLNLQLASRLAEGRARDSLQDAHLVSKLLLRDVRDIVSNMRDGGTQGLDEALRSLIQPIRSPNIHLHAEAAPSWLDPLHAHILYRAVQEGITNAIRHAQADNVWVSLEYSAHEATVTVRDDGRGVETLKPGGGLKGMQERLQTLGGRLDAGNMEARGFLLTARLPAPGTTETPKAPA